MLQTNVKDEIISRLDELSIEQQERVLDLVKSMTSRLPVGVPGHQLLKFVGCISPEDLALMAKASEECRQIDLEEWDKPIFPE